MTSEREWRRRWKPDLETQPWRSLAINDKSFLIKCVFSEDSYDVLVSDSAAVWRESLDATAVKKRSKKLNPSVEAPLSKLLEHLCEHVESQAKAAKYSVSFKAAEDDPPEETIVLTLSTKLAGLPFAWKFFGHPAEKSLLSVHLCCPLVTMVGELQRRQEELFKLLRSKDKEVADLKAQGVRASRKHLETAPFDETVFTNNMVASKGFHDKVAILGTSAFDSESQSLYRDIMMKHAWINRTPGEDSEGESLADEVAMETTTGSSATGAGHSWANRVPPSLVSGGATVSPTKSPTKSPAKSPGKAVSSPDVSPAKDSEMLRRQALERRLAAEEVRKDQKQKKKKIKF